MIGNNRTDFEIITDFGNLYRAYRKSKGRKSHSKSKQKFCLIALDGIYQLQKRLITKTYEIAPYHYFVIYEPKERKIMAGAFQDKIIQHSLCDNVLLPTLSREFLLNNFAGQIGKGTLYGLEWLKAQMYLAFCKYGYDCWIVKGDVLKFFYSIDHEILKDITEYFVADQNVYWLCEKYIDSTEGVGVPLGNQVSQVYSLMYLSGFDHFVTGELAVKYYGRYADDFYLIVPNKQYAQWCLYAIKEFMQTLNLALNGKTQIIPFKNGIKFCGFHTYVTRDGKVIRKLTNEKKRAAKKKYIRMAKGVKQKKISQEKFDESYYAWKNHISHGNCKKFGYEMDAIISEIMEGDNNENEI